MGENMIKSFRDLIKNKKIAYLPYKYVECNGVYDFKKTVPEVEKSYTLHYKKDTILTKSDYLKYPKRSSYDRIIILLGFLGGKYKISGLKEIASSTTNSKLGYKRASGIIILNDFNTQRPFAMLEASQISAVRTAASTAISIKYLAPKSINKVAFVGCGFLAETHALMWSQLYLKHCDTLHLYDVFERKAKVFARKIKSKYGINSVVCKNVESAVRDSDIIIPMTTEETPYIKSNWIKNGSLYSAVSLLDPELNVLAKSDFVVVDDLKMSMHEGRPLQKLSQTNRLGNTDICSIGEIISKKINLRKSNDTKIYYNPMGTIITDLAVSYCVLKNAFKQNKIKYLDV